MSTTAYAEFLDVESNLVEVRDAASRTPEEILFDDIIPAGLFAPDLIGLRCRISRIESPHFWPNLFALMLDQRAAAKFSRTDHIRSQMAANLSSIAKKLGEEIGLVVYEDTKPVGKPPNNPIAVLTSGMEPFRVSQLLRAVSYHAEVNFRPGVPINNIHTYYIEWVTKFFSGINYFSKQAIVPFWGKKLLPLWRKLVQQVKSLSLSVYTRLTDPRLIGGIKHAFLTFGRFLNRYSMETALILAAFIAGWISKK